MILIGTSGYSFPDWIGTFYPEDIERHRMLDYYVRHFSTVEVNATYYRIPPPSTLHAMARKTPPEFEFVVKTHQDMTHKRSLDPSLYESFARACEPLQEGGKLSGLIAQFPFSFRRTEENEEYLGDLKRRLPEVPLFVEFRHESWVRNGAFSMLEDLGVGFVSVDEPDLPGLVPPIARATGEIAYVRFHGRNKRNWWRRDDAPPEHVSAPEPVNRPSRAEAALGPLFSGIAGTGKPEPERPQPKRWSQRALLRYDYLYSEDELKEWVGKIGELAAQTKKTFVFFNNCHAGQAATGAKLMRRLLEGEGLL